MLRMSRIDEHDQEPVGKMPPTPGPAAITVLIAEERPLVLEALAIGIGAADDFVVIGVADDADSAISGALDYRPDIVLLDVDMTGGGGKRAARAISERRPELHNIAISAHNDRTTVGDMVSAGARGFISKDSPPDQMLDTLRRCAAGELVFTPVSANALMREYVKSSRSME